MTTFSVSRRMPYSAAQMFGIVAAVEHYPAFVPLCRSARVSARHRHEDGVETFEASLMVAHDRIPLAEEFSSRIAADAASLTVRTLSDTGPVRHLDARWTFRDVPGGSDIDLLVEYRMANPFLHMVLSASFDYVFRRIAAAFEARAHVLFGSPPARRAKPARMRAT